MREMYKGDAASKWLSSGTLCQLKARDGFSGNREWAGRRAGRLAWNMAQGGWACVQKDEECRVLAGGQAKESGWAETRPWYANHRCLHFHMIISTCLF